MTSWTGIAAASGGPTRLPVPYRIEGRSGHAWFARAGTAIEIRKAPMLPAIMREAERALAGQDRIVPRRPMRIPARDMVAVRSALPANAHPLRLAAPRPVVGANDNSDRPKTGRWGLIRQVLVVALLAVTLAAVYQLGRQHAAQNVISLPDPDRRGSALS